VRPPKDVVVAPRVYKVVVDGNGHAEDANVDGMTSFDQGRILIKGALTEDPTRDTLLHEILHALIDQTSVKRQLKDMDKDLEEDFVWALTPRLLGLLRDNPELVEYLTS